MPFASSIKHLAAGGAVLVAIAQALPALAQSSPVPPPPPLAAGYAPFPGQPPMDRAAWEQARADWIAECRANHRRDRHGHAIGGALIGGLAGGIAGNAIAGHGDKAVGTIAGAAVGAAAGGAIGSGADRREERRTMDYCESYLARYGGYGYGQMAYAYQPVMVMVPVMMVQPAMAVAAPPQPRECKETEVIEEWVPDGPHKRIIPPRPRPAPDKRIRIAPDKRTPAG